MHVVCGNYLYIMFGCKFADAFHNLLLFRKNASVGFRIDCLMPLDLKIEVLTEQVGVFLQNLLRPGHRSVEYLVRYLPGQAC